jgi:hypothetical protein
LGGAAGDPVERHVHRVRRLRVDPEPDLRDRREAGRARAGDDAAVPDAGAVLRGRVEHVHRGRRDLRDEVLVPRDRAEEVLERAAPVDHVHVGGQGHLGRDDEARVEAARAVADERHLAARAVENLADDLSHARGALEEARGRNGPDKADLAVDAGGRADLGEQVAQVAEVGEVAGPAEAEEAGDEEDVVRHAGNVISGQRSLSGTAAS